MKKAKKIKKRYFSPFTVFATLIVVILISFVLYGNISLNELTIENSNKQKELAAVIDANEILRLEIERKNSLGNIEQIATEQLGMVKLQDYQIHTVNLESDDSVEIVTSDDKNNIFDGIVASFNILLEYLN